MKFDLWLECLVGTATDAKCLCISCYPIHSVCVCVFFFFGGNRLVYIDGEKDEERAVTIVDRIKFRNEIENENVQIFHLHPAPNSVSVSPLPIFVQISHSKNHPIADVLKCTYILPFTMRPSRISNIIEYISNTIHWNTYTNTFRLRITQKSKIVCSQHTDSSFPSNPIYPIHLIFELERVQKTIIYSIAELSEIITVLRCGIVHDLWIPFHPY